LTLIEQKTTFLQVIILVETTPEDTVIFQLLVCFVFILIIKLF